MLSILCLHSTKPARPQCLQKVQNLTYAWFAQAAGFLVLVAGTLVYAKGDRKQEEQGKHEHEGPLQVINPVLVSLPG